MCIGVGGPKHLVDKYFEKLDERIVKYGIIFGKDKEDPNGEYIPLYNTRIESQEDTKRLYTEQKEFKKLGYETVLIKTSIKGKLNPQDNVLELKLTPFYSWNTPKGVILPV